MFSLPIPRALVGVGAALVLACGCSHDRQNACSSCGPCGGAAVPAKTAEMTPIPPKPVATAPAQPVAQMPPSLYIPPVTNERYVPPEKGIVVAQKPPPDEAAKSGDGFTTSLPVTEHPTKAVILPRRNYNDITARIEFDHASDHAWLVGTLNYVPQKQQWRLRYTSIDDEDKYGGSVTLDVGPQLMKPFKEGDLVRVSGTVLEPDSHEPSPLYQVKSIDKASK